LGKPIPSNDPTIIPPVNAQKALAATGVNNAATAGIKKVVGVSQVTFIGKWKYFSVTT
jgi:hypothetical protein